MTKYIQFDSKGRQTAITDLDGSCPEGYMALGTDEIDGKVFYLENNTIKSMTRTQENFDFLWEEDTKENALNAIRDMRNDKLRECDWTQFAGSPISAEKKAEWDTYRQALRDLPLNIVDARYPQDIIWPTQPSK
jgi:hypothetical protein